MKTLVVFSALVSITIAAPALQDGKLDSTIVPDHHIQEHPRIPELVKTERQSTLEQPTETLHNAVISATEALDDATGKTSLTRPLIVKRKSGLTLFRNSEEEKANSDPTETCGRQVKVKLCAEDGKFKEMLKSSTHDVGNGISADDDVKLSIMMAKEAVESLQRDLKNMENKNGAFKMAHDSESDAALHEDIEVARKALEHVQTNFDHLDTMRLHAALRDSDAMHDVRITLAKSEDEKLAQWKEAINNIQRNVEIASNIEDSFKTKKDQELLRESGLESIQQKSKIEDDKASHVALHEEQNRHAAEISHLSELTKDLPQKEGLQKEINSQLRLHDAKEEQHIADHMIPSASEAIEMKTVEIGTHHTLRSDSHKRQEHNLEEKLEDHVTEDHKKAAENIQLQNQSARTSESDVKVTKTMTSNQHQQAFSLKEVEDDMGKLDLDKQSEFKASENVADTHTASSTNTVTLLNPHMTIEHQRNTMENEFERRTDSLLPATGLHMKSVELINENKNMHDQIKSGVAMGKAALKSEMNHQSGMFVMKPKDASQTSLLQVGDKKTKEHLPTSVQKIHLHKLHNGEREHNDNIMKAASVEDTHRIDYNESDPVHPKQRKSEEMNLHHHFAGMKHAEDHLSHHMAAMKAAQNPLRQLETRPATSRWAHGFRNKPSMKAAEELTEDFHGIDHMRSSHLPEHHFNPSRMGVSHDFEMTEHTHQHSHMPSRFHNNMMSHTKMHDMMHERMPGAVPTHFHSNMREAMDGFGSEHTFKWMHSHESARNAYGSGLSGSSGSSGSAVGVFPNANSGGCGIPLLLSCSPSVVSGSLAKAHAAGPASYSPPSYRAEDEFSFHNKRDLKKTNEERGTNVLRTPSIIKQKTGTIEEIKL